MSLNGFSSPPAWYRSRPFFISVFWTLALFHLFIPLLNHFYFRTIAHDFAVYNFALYDYAHFRNSPCPVYLAPYPVSFFQDHFSLLLPLLSPLYWLFAPLFGTYSLLIIQWLLICAGAYASYLLVMQTRGDRFPAILALITYFLLFGRFTAYRADVNLVTMASALMPVFLLQFERRHKAYTIAVFILILLSREDMALWMFFACVFLAIRHRGDKPRVKMALGMAVAAVVFFIITFKAFIPLFLEDEHKKYSLFDYKALGTGPAEALSFVVSHPLKTLQYFYKNHTGDGYYDNVKTEFYLLYLCSGAVVLFLRPLYFIPLIPLIAKKMLNDSPIRWSTESYYAAEIVTLLPVLIFLLLSDLRSEKLRYLLMTGVCLATICMTLWRTTHQPGTLLLSEDNKHNFMSSQFYIPSRPVPEARKVMAAIPPDAAVTASSRFTPHLSFREKIYLFPRIDDAAYLLLFTDNDTYPLSPEQFSNMLKDMMAGGEWTIISQSKDILLMKRNEQIAG